MDENRDRDPILSCFALHCLHCRLGSERTTCSRLCTCQLPVPCQQTPGLTSQGILCHELQCFFFSFTVWSKLSALTLKIIWLQKTKSFRAMDAVQLVKCFPSTHKDPGLIPQHRINWVWWLLPVIPAFQRWRQDNKNQGHLWLHWNFQTSLGYMRVYLKKIDF